MWLGVYKTDTNKKDEWMPRKAQCITYILMSFVWYGWKQEHSNISYICFCRSRTLPKLVRRSKTMNKSFPLKKFIKKTSSNDMMLRSLAEMTAI